LANVQLRRVEGQRENPAAAEGPPTFFLKNGYLIHRHGQSVHASLSQIFWISDSPFSAYWVKAFGDPPATPVIANRAYGLPNGLAWPFKRDFGTLYLAGKKGHVRKILIFYI
jgi:hypothetical protein